MLARVSKAEWTMKEGWLIEQLATNDHSDLLTMGLRTAGGGEQVGDHDDQLDLSYSRDYHLVPER